MTAGDLWKAYVDNGNKDEKHESWAFCGGGKEADELLSLVKEGKKRGTASSLIAYSVENEPVPKVGDKSIILDSKNRAHLIIVTRKVTVTPFLQVHPYHGYLEGEGDRTLKFWREVHEIFFKPDYEAAGKDFDPMGEVVLEEFDVIYPPKYSEKDEIYLTLPIEEESEKYREYREEFRALASPMDGTDLLGVVEDTKEWVEKENGMWMDENLPSGYVSSTLLVAKRRKDEKVVGMINIRHSLNDHLLKIGGNVGYSVRPTERCKGYGKKMLSLSLPYLKALGNIRALVTCNMTNEASRRIITSNNGVDENTIDGIERYWIEL